MTNPEKVVSFLRRNRGVFFCDGCLADKVGVSPKEEVDLITSTLTLCPGFESLESGTCAGCGETMKKKVTRSTISRVTDRASDGTKPSHTSGVIGTIPH